LTSDPSGPPARPDDGAATPPPPTPPDEAPTAVEGDWTILSVPVDAPPPGPVVTEEDDEPGPTPAWAGAIPDGPGPTHQPPPGPPGSATFSLEGRPAPALYLLGWLLAVGGLALLFITTQAQPSVARSIMVIGALLSIALGLSAAAGYQVVARRDREARWYRGPAPLIVFGVVIMLSTLASGLLGDLVDPAQPAGFLAGLFVVFLGYVVTVWVFVVRSGALTWADMGWPTVGVARLRRALQGVGAGALVMIPATFAALMLAGLVATVLGVEAPQVVPTASTSAEALAIALAAAIVAPVGEELFFRGFALTAWVRDLPERSALIRSAVFFAVVHIANINAASFREGASQALLQVAVILPVGLVLGWLFLRRGIMAAIAGHVTYNGILLLLTLAARNAGS
jgi:membrane protease YdiL (CAAX protease family)